MTVELEDIWRLVNALLALAALIWLMVDLRQIRYTLSRRRLYLTFSLAGLLFAVVEGSIENMIQNNEIGLRTAITTAACVWCLLGLAFTQDEDRKGST